MREIEIRNYTPADEQDWVRCRVISFLDSAYFDDVHRSKEKFDNPAIELVAEIEGKIIGLLDLEYEKKIGEVGYKSDCLTGVIWHLAVLPEYRREGIASMLLKKALDFIKFQNIELIQAWTRDDKFVLDWYNKSGFEKKESYYHVFAEADECNAFGETEIPMLYTCNVYGQYTGDDVEMIKGKFSRVHECSLLELRV